MSSASSPDTVGVSDVDPNFKSTLPPRKRAKTKEEKEQRRVERILRNRRAAHASREKKRKHVEYLESYVVKLEENLASLSENFDAVSALVDASKLKSLNLKSIQDLSDLKEKIHSNLNASVATNEEEDEEPVKKRKISQSPSFSPMSSSFTTQVSNSASQEPQIKVEESDGNELLSISNKDNNYFNYLSPISINSPINSPIDLTIKKSEDDLPHLSDFSSDIAMVDSTKGYDFMEQNSAVILSPHGRVIQSVF